MEGQPMTPNEAASLKLAKLKAKLAADRSLDRSHPSPNVPHTLTGSGEASNKDLANGRPDFSSDESDGEELTRPEDMNSDAEEDGLLGQAKNALWTAVGGVLDAAANVIEKVKGNDEAEEGTQRMPVGDTKLDESAINQSKVAAV